MSQFLLDVNVLIALHTPSHANFPSIQRWFYGEAADSFATCSMTQAGFMRLSSRISADPNIGMDEAKISLAKLCAFAGHEFWPMDTGYLKASAPFEHKIHGHQQITDAYLLAVAIQRNGKLATLDRGILHLAGAEFRDSVELLS